MEDTGSDLLWLVHTLTVSQVNYYADVWGNARVRETSIDLEAAHYSNDTPIEKQYK